MLQAGPVVDSPMGPRPQMDLSPDTPMTGIGGNVLPVASDGQYPRFVPGSPKMGGMTDETKPTTGSQAMVMDAKRAITARWRADMHQPGAPNNAYVLQSMGYTPAELHLMQASGQVRL
jgi:hypothetical protein